MHLLTNIAHAGLLACLLAGAFAAPTDTPNPVWRGDRRHFSQIVAAGGYQTRGGMNPGVAPSRDVVVHIADSYRRQSDVISTSAREKVAKSRTGSGGHYSKIDTRNNPNYVDAEQAHADVGKRYGHKPEAEYPHLGALPLSDIMGHRQRQPDGKLGPEQPNPAYEPRPPPPPPQSPVKGAPQSQPPRPEDIEEGLQKWSGSRIPRPPAGPLVRRPVAPNAGTSGIPGPIIPLHRKRPARKL